MKSFQTGSNLKRRLKYAWSSLGCKTGLEELHLRCMNRKNKLQSVIILVYHRVITPDECHDNFSSPHITVTKETFEKHVEFLLRYYNIISLEDFYGYHSSRKPLPPRTAVVTFDDGWKDNFINAFPILKKYRVPTTIFLSTGFIGTNYVFWQEKLRFLLREFLKFSSNEREAYLKNNKDIPAILKDCMTLSNEAAIWDMPKNLKKMDEGDRNSIMDGLEEYLGFRDFPIKNNRFMTWENAREMMKAKIDFGSHTVNHKILTKLASKEVLEELSLSKSKIEKELNMQVRAFAYPNGTYNNIVMENVKKAGYQYAVGLDKGLNSMDTDHYCLKRLNINELRFLKPGGGFSESIFSARLTNWL